MKTIEAVGSVIFSFCVFFIAVPVIIGACVFSMIEWAATLTRGRN